MVSIEEHKRSLSEFLKDIEEKVKSGLTVERQKLIGFAASEAAGDMLAIFLHQNNLITPGFNINHRFFASDRIANEKFNFNFSKKAEILYLMVRQDNYRSVLCYGKAKEKEKVEEAVKNLYEIKKCIEALLGEAL